ncbi:hypothetical protein FHW00_003811 [Ochrobactrum sp. P6BSIII]|nr:hypothetical protein [Ochrobactrum sp. P6BSIII]
MFFGCSSKCWQPLHNVISSFSNISLSSGRNSSFGMDPHRVYQSPPPDRAMRIPFKADSNASCLASPQLLSIFYIPSPFTDGDRHERRIGKAARDRRAREATF